MFQIAVCDDEKKIVEDIKAKVKTEFNKRGFIAEIISFDNSRSLMEHIEKSHVDVLFLDIDMPYYSGMDIAGFINQSRMNTLIVFVTSHDALVYQTFEYRPFGFIRKGYLDTELSPLVDRVIKELNECKEEFVINKGQEIIRIPFSEILYVEGDKNYLNIKTKTDEVRIRDTMTSIENELKGKGFIRCHKGYLVNGTHIGKLKSGEIEVGDDDKMVVIPVGRSYEKDVKRSLLEFLRG